MKDPDCDCNGTWPSTERCTGGHAAEFFNRKTSGFRVSAFEVPQFPGRLLSLPPHVNVYHIQSKNIIYWNLLFLARRRLLNMFLKGQRCGAFGILALVLGVRVPPRCNPSAFPCNPGVIPIAP